MAYSLSEEQCPPLSRNNRATSSERMQLVDVSNAYRKPSYERPFIDSLPGAVAIDLLSTGFLSIIRAMSSSLLTESSH